MPAYLEQQLAGPFELGHRDDAEADGRRDHGVLQSRERHVRFDGHVPEMARVELVQVPLRPRHHRLVST